MGSIDKNKKIVQLLSVNFPIILLTENAFSGTFLPGISSPGTFFKGDFFPGNLSCGDHFFGIFFSGDFLSEALFCTEPIVREFSFQGTFFRGTIFRGSFFRVLFSRTIFEIVERALNVF